MTYRTRCPECGGRLMLIRAVVLPWHLYIRPDGFAFADAKKIDTEDELTACEDCDFHGPLIAGEADE